MPRHVFLEASEDTNMVTESLRLSRKAFLFIPDFQEALAILNKAKGALAPLKCPRATAMLREAQEG